ncbi:MAG TPA: hypothetical protein VFJ16_15455 [Longimicrobium sp.]|nr:hypothetical protein [Longimicrobium sp.]
MSNVDQPANEDPDVTALTEFLDRTEQLLNHLVAQAETLSDALGQPIFIQELVPEMKLAWNSAKPRFDTLRDRLKATPVTRLDEYGLTGSERSFKQKIVNYWSKLWGKLPTIDVLRRLLDAIDNLLKSILSAVGLGDALEEFKEGLKHAIRG